MFAFLLIVQTLIAASLVGMILMQRSEGGGLGVGGSSSGFMTARGAADFLTRSTAVLGGMFIVLSIVMAAMPAPAASRRKSIPRSPARRQPQSSRLRRQPAPVQQAEPEPEPAGAGGSAGSIIPAKSQFFSRRGLRPRRVSP